MTVNGVPWPNDVTRRNSHTFNCRMLVRPPDDSDDEASNCQEARQKYETMQCFAVYQPKSILEEGEDLQSCLICVARPILTKDRTQSKPTHETFTTRQDLRGNIVFIDKNAAQAYMKPGWEEVVRRCLHTFCQTRDNEMSLARRHNQEVLKSGFAHSPFYKLMLADGTIISAQTKSQILRNPATNQPHFVVSMHTVIREQADMTGHSSANSMAGPAMMSPATHRDMASRADRDNSALPFWETRIPWGISSSFLVFRPWTQPDFSSTETADQPAELTRPAAEGTQLIPAEPFQSAEGPWTTQFPQQSSPTPQRMSSRASRRGSATPSKVLRLVDRGLATRRHRRASDREPTELT
ncbi:nuclear receptor coactivator 2-like [Callorhinchus milii]|uniref:nuclear receptor coactivator 2-like n=1 Tax=Callorhinchus milii TaxID=7868 RepID=UPI001C3F7A9E|nr:nuclear receptor coactivator 2-like [Callorhinchus milii]